MFGSHVYIQRPETEESVQKRRGVWRFGIFGALISDCVEETDGGWRISQSITERIWQRPHV